MEVMKQLRQRAIRDVVVARPIRTQQELAAALRDRGFRTTQATMSRDVAELGLVKAPRNGTQAYALPTRLRYVRSRTHAHWHLPGFERYELRRPDGTLDCYQPYGQEGLLIAEIDITAATGLLEARCKLV